MIKIIIKNIVSQIVGLEDKKILSSLDDALSYYVQGYAFTKAYKSGWWDSKEKKFKRWDGKNHLLRANGKFLTGLLLKVKKILDKYKIEYVLEDKRKEVPFGHKIATQNIEKREYQMRVLDAYLVHKNGIIKAATGSGKSVMITEIVANANVKTMIYVIGIDLLYQMRETLEKMLCAKIGIIGDGIVDIHKINVCTVWTAANALGEKYTPFDDEDYSKEERFDNESREMIVKTIREAEMTIYDECQMLATRTLQTINAASDSAYYKCALSGTPWRDDGADLLLEAVCGEIIVEVTASELIHDGWLVTPKIKFIDVPEYNGDLSEQYHSIYKSYIVENEVRNNIIIKAATKLVEKNRKVLILVKNIKHGEILLDSLRGKFEVYFVKGDVDSTERNRIRKDFVDGKIQIIIATVIYDQGIDLPVLDSMILAGSGKSSGRALQRLGRVIRQYPGKKDAIVVDFIDHAKYLREHTAKRIEIYRRESAFDISIPIRSEKKSPVAKNVKKIKKFRHQKLGTW